MRSVENSRVLQAVPVAAVLAHRAVRQGHRPVGPKVQEAYDDMGVLDMAGVDLASLMKQDEDLAESSTLEPREARAAGAAARDRLDDRAGDRLVSAPRGRQSRRSESSRAGVAAPVATCSSSAHPGSSGRCVQPDGQRVGCLGEVREGREHPLGASPRPGRTSARPGCRRRCRRRAATARWPSCEVCRPLPTPRDVADRPLGVRHQPVDQRRLADAGLAEQHARPVGEPLAQHLDAGVVADPAR